MPLVDAAATSVDAHAARAVAAYAAAYAARVTDGRRRRGASATDGTDDDAADADTTAGTDATTGAAAGQR